MILLSKLFDPEKTETMLRILQNEFPLAIWETLYVTVIATLFSVIAAYFLQAYNRCVTFCNSLLAR